MTNIGWVIDAREIERQFSIPVARLINDFLANGYGLLTLDDAQTITLQVRTLPLPPPYPSPSLSLSLSLYLLQQKCGRRGWGWPARGVHHLYAHKWPLKVDERDVCACVCVCVYLASQPHPHPARPFPFHRRPCL